MIAEVGSQVAGFVPGDTVVVMPQVTCGECYPCLHGMYHICDNLKVMGFQTGGAAQEFFPVKADSVLKLPEGMSLDEAALIEPCATWIGVGPQFVILLANPPDTRTLSNDKK